MSTSKKFKHNGISYSISVTKSNKGEFVGFPDIDGIKIKDLASGSQNESDAFDKAEALVKEAIDKQENEEPQKKKQTVKNESYIHIKKQPI